MRPAAARKAPRGPVSPATPPCRSVFSTARSCHVHRLRCHHGRMNRPAFNPSSASLAARDLAVLWHPCTQMHDHETIPMVPVVRGEGAWLIDADGRRYLDGISSWWTNLFGHANPRIGA